MGQFELDFKRSRKKKQKITRLTYPPPARIISGRLFKKQPQSETIAEKVLKPLLQGETVVLEVTDAKLLKKKRIKNSVLFIVPFSSFGGDSNKLLVSLPGYGSEIIDVTKDLKLISFVRLGLNVALSRALIHGLQIIYSGVESWHLKAK